MLGTSRSTVVVNVVIVHGSQYISRYRYTVYVTQKHYNIFIIRFRYTYSS